MIDPLARPLVFRENKRIFRAYLAEDYDGIGQYVKIALSRNSVTSAFRALIASGDFGTGAHYPRGTEVLVFSNHGQLEVITLGANPQIARREAILNPETDPTDPTHFIIDDYENRTVVNEWGTPSRGTPDWVDLGGSVFGSPGTTEQILVSAIGPSTGWGRFVFNTSAVQYMQFPFTNGASHGLYLPLPEITNLDEFKLEFDLAVSPIFGDQGIGVCQIIIGTESPRRGIDLPFQFEHFTFPASDHLDYFLARDSFGGLGFTSTTHSEQIALTHSFDGHITIDRSVSRGNTLVTVGAFVTTVFSPIGPAPVDENLKRLYIFYSDHTSDPNAVEVSTCSIDNIELTNNP